MTGQPLTKEQMREILRHRSAVNMNSQHYTNSLARMCIAIAYVCSHSELEIEHLFTKTDVDGNVHVDMFTFIGPRGIRNGVLFNMRKQKHLKWVPDLSDSVAEELIDAMLLEGDDGCG